MLRPWALLWPLLLQLSPQSVAGTPVWSYVSLFEGDTESADFYQNIVRTPVSPGVTSASTEMSVQITQLSGELKLREMANLATAGRVFVERSVNFLFRRDLVIYAVEPADVEVTKQGGGVVASTSLAAGDVATLTYGEFFSVGSHLWAADITATGDVIPIMAYNNKILSFPLLPPAAVIFGVCTAWCAIANPGGSAITVHRVCSDGLVDDIASNNFYVGLVGWLSPVCRYEAPAGYTLAGLQETDGGGQEATAFISTDQFLVRFTVPLYSRIVTILSDQPAECIEVTDAGVATYMTLTGHSETPGGPGAYVITRLLIGAGTLYCCDRPVGALVNFDCAIAPFCVGLDTNVLAMPQPAESPLPLSDCIHTTTLTATTATVTTVTTTTVTTTATTVLTTTDTDTTITATITTVTTTTVTTTATTFITTSTTSTATTATATTATSSATTATATTATATTATSSATTATTATATTATATTATATTGTATTATATTVTVTTLTLTSTTATSATATTTSGTSATATTSTTSRSTSSTLSVTTATSTTTTTTTLSLQEPTPPVDALLVIARKWEPRERDNLQQQNDSDMVLFSMWDITTAAALVSPETLAPVVVGNTGVEVSLPASIFAVLGVEEVVLSATYFGPTYNDRLAWPGENWASEGGAPLGQGGADPNLESLQVLAVLHLDLAGHNVSGLAEPIKISLDVNRSDGVECAYWDEADGVWRTDGVTTQETPEGKLLCLSTHLSLFGAILRGFLAAVLCSQVTLFQPDAIKELAVSDWYRQPGSYVLWGMLILFVLLGALATALDCFRKKVWSDEQFLIVFLQEEAAAEEEAAELNNEQEDNQEKEGRVQRTCGAVCSWCKESNALRDMLDEVLSSYFKYFGEVRDIVEALVEGLECSCGMFNCGQLCAVLSQFMTSVVAKSAERQAAAAEGISADFASFAMEDDDLHHILVHRSAFLNQGSNVELDKGQSSEGGLDGTEIHGSEGQHQSAHACKAVESKSQLPQQTVSRMSAPQERAEPWSVVLDKLMARTHHFTEAACRYSSLPGAVCRLLLWQHPIGICLVRCVFLSSKMRVLLLLVDSMGSVMLGTVFFTTTGSVPSKKNRSLTCATQDVGEAIGRLIAIALASVILSSLPAMFLASLCTRGIKQLPAENSPEWKRQLRVWKVQDAIIYLFGISYLLFCFGFICLFLANTSPRDQTGWLISIVLSLVLDNVVIPLAVAALVPFLAVVFLSLLSCVRRTTKEEIVGEAAEKVASKPNMTLEIAHV